MKGIGDCGEGTEDLTKDLLRLPLLCQRDPDPEPVNANIRSTNNINLINNNKDEVEAEAQPGQDEKTYSKWKQSQETIIEKSGN